MSLLTGKKSRMRYYKKKLQYNDPHYIVQDKEQDVVECPKLAQSQRKNKNTKVPAVNNTYIM